MRLTPPIGPWTPFTPTVSGSFALGNGSWAGSAYQLLGKTVRFRVVLTVGSTTVISDEEAFQLVLPFAVKGIANMPVGLVEYHDASEDARAEGRAVTTATDSATVVVTTNDGGGIMDLFTPFEWASGDTLAVTGEYETT